MIATGIQYITMIFSILYINIARSSIWGSLLVDYFPSHKQNKYAPDGNVLNNFCFS
jgi:hypothetical protein